MEEEELKETDSQKTPVTYDIARVGDKVIRGKDWCWSNQDGGDDPKKNNGTITKIFTEVEKQFVNGDVQVLWDYEKNKGMQAHLAYRANDEFQDLYFVKYDHMARIMEKLDDMLGFEPQVDELQKKLDQLKNKYD